MFPVLRLYLRILRAVKLAVPPTAEAVSTILTAVEQIIFRLALLGFFAHGIYKAISVLIGGA